MERIKRFVSTVEHVLSTKKKRHIIGGILMSASIFFGGLAVTVLTTKIEEENDEAHYL
jgi:hypothetical protein